MQGVGRARVLPVTILLAGLACILLSQTVEGIDLAEVGNWSRTVDANDLLAGAGTNLISTYESNSDQGLLTISGTTGDADNWRVDVRKSDISWNNNLTLSVKRTGSGSGTGSISGGGAYQAVGDTDSALFSGSGDRINIPMQLQLSGISVSIPPGTYSASIIYTVVDTE